MSLSAKIREQLISSFRAELAEHVQTMNEGLLALEQRKVTGEQRKETLDNVLRAAHSLKGAARAVGVGAIEQLAHALEDVLGAMQQGTLELTPGLFTACYHALDAIQAVQAVYESGETTPPAQALQALADLDALRRPPARKAEDIKGEATGMPGDLAAGDKMAVEAGREKESVEREVAEPAHPPNAGAPPQRADETIRVSVSKLDALMAQLSELLVTKIRAEQRMTQIQQAQVFMAAWQKEWLAIRSGYSRLARHARALTAIESVDMETASVRAQQAARDKYAASTRTLLGDGRLEKELVRLLDYVDDSQERLREMHALMNTLAREYAQDTMNMSLVIEDLEQEIKRTRMLPLATITGPFGRMVRDLAHTAGKEVVFEIQGADVELDKRVLEQIKDPLIHLLRNAIYHGIEPPEQRVAAAKPRVGTITIVAEHLGKDVVICVSDDGAGLDIEAIRQTAIRRGIKDAQALSEAELKELIFDAGFSTTPIVNDVSGRGVGLDVVRRNVEALQGTIRIEGAPGAGTAFTLTLPLTLTSSRGLLVEVARQLFAIPLNVIERIVYVNTEDIIPLGGHDTLRYNGRQLSLVHLADVLGLPRAQRENDQYSDVGFPAIVLVAAERRMAFAVDELADEQEIVIKGMGKQLARVGGIAGASVMGNGDVVLILHAADLIKIAQRGERRPVREAPPTEGGPAGAGPRQKQVLVVDDSITTRTLEKNILEAAGYLVRLAIDGQEALDVIATGMPDLIIADLAMPRLDGFGLTERVKSDARTAHVPVVLVTSLDSPEDKARGIEAGADAYIVKSRFDQTNLLEMIEQLI